MLEELQTLLSAVPARASRDEYLTAVIENNVLHKETTSTRRISAQRLSELYALDSRVPIFRFLRRLWETDSSAQPILALLSALARDPLLRASVPAVIQLGDGRGFDRTVAVTALRVAAGSRLNDAILDKVVRNVASSWTQSGHLVGRTFKNRRRVAPTPSAVTMALFLGYLQGYRGAALLRTVWCEVLDAPAESLAAIASRAANAGLMVFRQSDDVIEIAFPDVLSMAEQQKTSHG